MVWYSSPGTEYMVNVSARYSVLIEDDMMAHEAEDVAWDVLEQTMKKAGWEKVGEGHKYTDHNKFEVYETKEITPALLGGHRVVVDVNFEYHTVTHDIDEVFYDAVAEIEDIDLPENVTLLGTEQLDFIQTGERVLIAHGDDV